MLPKELEYLFSELDPEDFELRLSSVVHSGRDMIIEFVLTMHNTDEEDKATQKWRIQAAGYKKSRVSFESTDFLEIEDDHPLLWEFPDTQCQLYFSGTCKDTTSLFYDLYTRHRTLFEDYQPFAASVAATALDSKRFQFTNGLLAKGSKKLMAIYGDCLVQNGLGFTIIGERPATYWDGSGCIKQLANLQILLFRNGYVIAQKFSFQKRAERNE